MHAFMKRFLEFIQTLNDSLATHRFFHCSPAEDPLTTTSCFHNLTPIQGPTWLTSCFKTPNVTFWLSGMGGNQQEASGTLNRIGVWNPQDLVAARRHLGQSGLLGPCYLDLQSYMSSTTIFTQLCVGGAKGYHRKLKTTVCRESNSCESSRQSWDSYSRFKVLHSSLFILSTVSSAWLSGQRFLNLCSTLSSSSLARGF